MTAGELSGRDYGHDAHAYPPHSYDAGDYPEYSGWDGESPVPWRNGSSRERPPGDEPWPGGPPPGYRPARFAAQGYPGAEAYPPAPGHPPAADGYPQPPGYPPTPQGYPPADGYPRPQSYPPTDGYPPPPAAGYPGPAYPEYPGYPSGYPSGYPEGYPEHEYRAAYPGAPAQPGPPAYPDPDRPPPVRRTPAGRDPDDRPTTNFRTVTPNGRPPDGRPPDGRPPDGRPPDGRPPDGRSATRRPAGRAGRGKRKGLPLWQELPLLLVIALCLAILVRTFLLQAFFIPSGSMEDTLVAGDRVLVNKVIYNFREPARGEVVVFEGTDAWAPLGTEDENLGAFTRVGRALGDLVGVSRPGVKDYIKRVVGLPGDTVSCCDVEGRVFVNGQPLDEDYVIRDSPLDDVPLGDCRGRRFDEVVVQPGHMFVMGDHRQVSQDSRCQGQVPLDNVIGRAFVIVWPNDRWRALSQPDTFGSVPPAAAAPAQPASDAPAPGSEFAFLLPVLLLFRTTFRDDSASFRLIGRGIGRRLAT